MIDLETTRERLREWAIVFRDRHRKGSAGSAERAWRSPQVWEAPEPRKLVDVLRAGRTQDLLQRLPVVNHHAIKWRYVAPWLPQGIALRDLSRRAGYKVTPPLYQELVYLGECRLAVLLDREPGA